MVPRQPKVALITESRYERPAKVDRNVQNILDEDALLEAALAERGITTARVDWARPDVDWGTFDAAVLRTTWDYFDRIDEFRAWLPRVAAKTRLFNPLEQVQWNMDKHYLLDLEAKGVQIVPTHIVEQGDALDLARRIEDAGWPAAVIKPAVSGAARHTYRVRAENAGEIETSLSAVVAVQAMLIQPFIPSVLARGEVTLVMIDGECTHAVRKVAAPGDFRVQDDHGGTVHPHRASEAERSLARLSIAACQSRPLYGRVDMVDDESGVPRVIELELIEPELWFRMCPAAAARLADGLARALD